MSLDNIQLPSFLVQELYKKSLIESENNQLSTDSLKTSDFSFLGKNQKKILIIVSEENVVYLTDKNLELLVGMLSACNLSLNDVALVNYDRNRQLEYQTIQDKFNPEVIIFFGIEPSTLSFPLQFPEYQLQSYNRQTYLSVPSLTLLSEQIPEKKKLWVCLQKLFLA